MGIEVSEWPPGAFEQASLLAQSLLECSHGNHPNARKHLTHLIAAIILLDSPDDAGALSDQVLAQPELSGAVQRALLAALESRPGDLVQAIFKEVFGDTVGVSRLRDTVERARQGGTRVTVVGELWHGDFYLRLYDDSGESLVETRLVVTRLLPYV
jgi:hypothetical protein